MEKITLEQVDEFYKFLQGEDPDTIHMSKYNHPKLNEKAAFRVIWFLQEHLRILPDTYERCNVCGNLFDTCSSGLYWETKGKHYCDGCSYVVPYNYDRGKR